MNMQMQASRSRSQAAPSKSRSVRTKKRVVPQDNNVEKIGARRSAILLQEQAHANKAVQLENEKKITSESEGYTIFYITNLPRTFEEAEELGSLAYSVSQGDSSIVSFDISSASGQKKVKWDLREFPAAKDYRKPSWTIDVYDRKRQAGDTVWFRATNNGTSEYKEYEDTEILGRVGQAIQMNPRICFYLRTKFGRHDDRPAERFESDIILRALRQILQRAESKDAIVIPDLSILLLKPALKQLKQTKRSTKQKKELPKPEPPCFLSWLLLGLSGRSDRNSAFIKCF